MLRTFFPFKNKKKKKQQQQQEKRKKEEKVCLGNLANDNFLQPPLNGITKIDTNWSLKYTSMDLIFSFFYPQSIQKNFIYIAKFDLCECYFHSRPILDYLNCFLASAEV